jgi:hypothetical protein
MRRSFTVLAVLAATGLGAGSALAQSYPGDAGSGVQRGIEQMNNSGQVGTVTLFGTGAGTRAVVDLKGADDRTEPVRIYRGPSCDDLGAKPQYLLSDLHAGRSTSVVRAPIDKLLSGNYNVVVFSSNQAGARSTACGHLYAS